MITVPLRRKAGETILSTSFGATFSVNGWFVIPRRDNRKLWPFAYAIGGSRVDVAFIDNE